MTIEKRAFEQTTSPYTEILTLPEIRVSTAGFVSICDTQGRQLLIVSQERLLRGGKRELNPIGGGIAATPEGAVQVKRIVGVEKFESDRSPLDLRFVTSGAKLEEYRTWFLRREGRETDPTREMIEELCQEEMNGQRPPLTESDLAFTRMQKVRFAIDIAKTQKTGKEGILTLRFIEITPVILLPETIEKLLKEAVKPDSLVRFVTPEEILNSRTSDGESIGGVAKTLIQNYQIIPELKQ